MGSVKQNTVSTRQKKPFVNPFVKMIEDKKNISKAIEEGKPLSSRKDSKFVKPV